MEQYGHAVEVIQHDGMADSLPEYNLGQGQQK
jgi:hypothetical protein